MKRILSFFLTILTFLSGLFAPSINQPDTAILLQAYRTAYIQDKISLFSSVDSGTTTDALLRHIASAQDGKYFSDYHYRDNFRAETVHLARTLFLALQYAKSRNNAQQKALAEAVDGLVLYYATEDYQSPNWWYNEIYTPNCLAEVLLLMGDAVTEGTRKTAMTLIERGVFACNPEATEATGANLLWYGECTFKYCALTADAQGLSDAVLRFTEEIQYKNAEGIRTDGAFFQHKERLYTGGYGLAFAESVASVLYVLKDTSVCPSKDALKPYGKLVTEGLRPVMVGKHLDYNTVGREIARPGGLCTEGLAGYLRLLLQVRNMPDKFAIWQFMRSVVKDSYCPTGLHYFDQAHQLVLRGKDFYFSFRGVGEKLYYAETLNGENFLSYNLSYGNTTALMRTGSEYDGINPIWDYSLIPGTTAIYEDDEALKAHTEYSSRRMHAIGGGMVQKQNGVCFSKSEHEGISATVACFASGNSVLLLGNGLRNDKSLPMVTTVEQCFWQGEVKQEANSVLHNGIRYTSLLGTLIPKAETRTGSWKRNRASSSDEPVTGDVFTLTIENDGAYAYTISAEKSRPDYRIVQNNSAVQAVITPDNTLIAVFYKDGNFQHDGKTYEGKKEDIIMQRV